MGRFFKTFLNLSQRNLLKNLVILFKIWRKIGPLLKLRGQNSTTKGSFLTTLAESTMHRLKGGHF